MSPEYVVFVKDKDTREFERAVVSAGGKILSSGLSREEMLTVIEGVWAKESAKARGSLSEFKQLLANPSRDAYGHLGDLGFILEYPTKAIEFGWKLAAIFEGMLPDKCLMESVAVRQSAAQQIIVYKDSGILSPKQISLTLEYCGLTGIDEQTFVDLAQRHNISPAGARYSVLRAKHELARRRDVRQLFDIHS